MIIGVFLSGALSAQDADADSVRKWFVPSSARVQFAGNIGMLSIGPGWSFLNNRIDVEYSMGYVPKFEAEEAIFIHALKGIYTTPLQINLSKLKIKPVSVGVAISHTLGDQFNKYQRSSQFPPRYYWWVVPYRFAFVYRAEGELNIDSKFLKGIGSYFEVSIWDLSIYNYSANENGSYINFTDLFTFGIGTKIYF